MGITLKPLFQGQRGANMERFNQAKCQELTDSMKKSYQSCIEMDFAHLVDRYDVLKYNGDGKTFSNGKRPDFIVVGQNKVVEIFEESCHNPGDEIALVESYKSVGLDCLVVWEHDLEEYPIATKAIVGEFIK